MCARRTIFSKALFFIFALNFFFTSTSPAKSLYVGMHNTVVQAYKIVGDHLQYQANSQGDMNEWTGLTIDPNSGMVFATTEAAHNIHLLNARTMIFEETQTKVKVQRVQKVLQGSFLTKANKIFTSLEDENDYLFTK